MNSPCRRIVNVVIASWCLTLVAHAVVADDPGEAEADFIASADESGFSPEKLKSLMRPTYKLAMEWQAKTGGVGLASYDAGITFPIYPIFGPPPPFIDVGFNFMDIDAPSTFGLPSDLYETTVGLAWMRRVNEKWMTRFTVETAFATDGNNSSSDAWRFRGGAFALYRRDPRWTWAFGVLTLGRNDIPVVPAVGVVYQPQPGLRFDLMLPKPRIAFLLVDNGPRQQWGYVGAGLNGGTWGVERPDGVDDQLSYGDFRIVLGWESTPTPEPGMPFTRGRKLEAELGYVFSRDFEFENAATEISLRDAFMIRVSARF